jgi:hypothetical protein
MSAPLINAAASTCDRTSSFEASTSAGLLPTALVPTERSHGAPYRAGESTRSSRLAVRLTAAMATAMAAATPMSAVASSTSDPDRPPPGQVAGG